MYQNANPVKHLYYPRPCLWRQHHLIFWNCFRRWNILCCGRHIPPSPNASSAWGEDKPLHQVLHVTLSDMLTLAVCPQGKAVIEHYIKELMAQGIDHIVQWKEPDAQTTVETLTSVDTDTPQDNTPASSIPRTSSIGAKPKATNDRAKPQGNGWSLSDVHKNSVHILV